MKEEVGLRDAQWFGYVSDVNRGCFSLREHSTFDQSVNHFSALMILIVGLFVLYLTGEHS